jgi:addiction module HigA family antidote
VGRANGSRECAPDDRLRETHRMQRELMGFAALYPSYALPQRLTNMAPVVHPGCLLKRELTARRLSANRLSLDIGVPSGRVTDILKGRRSITAETAVRLGGYLAMARSFGWICKASTTAVASSGRRAPRYRTCGKWKLGPIYVARWCGHCD